jgi:dipeptide transport system permease protein
MGLREYIIRRILLVIPIMLGVVILIFAVLQIIPPTARALVFARSVQQLRDIPAIIRAHGLDQPAYIQFGSWLSQILQGNFGLSITSGRQPVLKALLDRLPATVEIVIYSAPLIVFFGIWFGTTAAVNRDKAADHLSRVTSILASSLPSFFIGMVLLAIFGSSGLALTSIGRVSRPGAVASSIVNGLFHQYTGLYTIDALLNLNFSLFLDAVNHLILPIAVLVFIQSATMVRVTRSSMLEALSKTYIVAARAKGLSRKETIYKHARRNALIPVITISGLLVGGMFTGLTITETVFNFPGIGNFAATAAIGLDVGVVIAYALFSAIVFVSANLIVDILYAYIDPRIRLG